MAGDPVINVDVMISDELRRLLAFGAGGARVSTVQPAATQAPQQPAPEVPDTVNWDQIVLRRDGQRPLVFRGLPVLTRNCISARGGGEQTLALYLADDRTVYASLTFAPPQTAPARPAHHCQSIQTQSEFVRFVNGWCPEMSFEAGAAPDSHQHLAADKSAVRSAFNAMAADCLSKGVVLA